MTTPAEIRERATDILAVFVFVIVAFPIVILIALRAMEIIIQ